MRAIATIIVGLLVAQFCSVVFAQRPVPVSYWGLGARDYTNNLEATDRFTYPGSLPAVESAMGNVAKVVYVKGQSPSIQLTIENLSGTAIAGTISFHDFRIVLSNGLIAMFVPPSSQSVTIPGTVGSVIGTTTITLTLANLPPYIAIGSIRGQVKAEASADIYHSNGTLFLLSGTSIMNQSFPQDIVYVVNSTPVGLQSKPWVDLLDSSCNYAFGESSEESIRRKMTNGMYFSGRPYFGGGAAYAKTVPGGFAYRLKSALEEPLGAVNCDDVAVHLALLLQSVGVQAGVRTYTPDPATLFRTNTGWLIGAYNPGTPSVTTFNLHTVTTSGGLVYDACMAHERNLSGQLHYLPAHGWNSSGYWQTPWQGQFVGLVSGPASSPSPAAINHVQSNPALVSLTN